MSRGHRYINLPGVGMVTAKAISTLGKALTGVPIHIFMQRALEARGWIVDGKIKPEIKEAFEKLKQIREAA